MKGPNRLLIAAPDTPVGTVGTGGGGDGRRRAQHRPALFSVSAPYSSLSLAAFLSEPLAQVPRGPHRVPSARAPIFRALPCRGSGGARCPLGGQVPLCPQQPQLRGGTPPTPLPLPPRRTPLG